MRKTKIERACQSCGATGLYVGMAERGGAAVVCHTCKGTGKETMVIDWEPFTGRKDIYGVSVVFKVNPGICVAPGVVPGGMAYEAWKRGEEFGPGMEMRKHTCPCWWYQTEDYNRRPEWDECNSTLGSTFSKCPHFADKAACWERFDKEDVFRAMHKKHGGINCGV